MVRILWSPIACRVSAKSKIHTDLAFQDSNMDWICRNCTFVERKKHMISAGLSEIL